MNTKNLLFTLLFTLLLPFACDNQPTEIPVIDMDNPSGFIDLKISDLLEDISIVALENNDDLVLSIARMTYTVTDRYILVNTGEKLLQFDRKGKYIRTLAFVGNGPNEISGGISNLLVDEKRETLYFTDFRGMQSISAIHLPTGTFQEFIKPDLKSFSIQQIDSHGNMYGFLSPSLSIEALTGQTSKAPDSLILAFRYNPDDLAVTAYTGHHGFPSEGTRKAMFRQGEQIFFCVNAYSDTLFAIKGDIIIPQCVVKLKNPAIDIVKGGVSVKFMVSSAHATIIEKNESRMDIQMDGNTISSINVYGETLAYLCLHQKGELQTIRSITIDPLAKTIDMNDYLKERNGELPISPIPSVSGLWGHYKVEAYNMIALIDGALKGNKLSAIQRKTLEEVANQIDEDSNPVLIIGKIK